MLGSLRNKIFTALHMHALKNLKSLRTLQNILGILISFRVQIWETKQRDLPWKQKPVDNLTISAQDIPQDE
jgi:hypothetical protein